MEMFNKVMNIITTLYPRTTMRVEKQGSSYVIVDECTWFGKHEVTVLLCKQAVADKTDLLKL